MTNSAEVIDLRLLLHQAVQFMRRQGVVLLGGLALAVVLAAGLGMRQPVRWHAHALLVNQVLNIAQLTDAINAVGQRLPQTALHPRVAALRAEPPRVAETNGETLQPEGVFAAWVTGELADTTGHRALAAQLVAELEKGPLMAERKARGISTVQVVYGFDRVEGPRRPLLPSVAAMAGALLLSLVLALVREALQQGRALTQA